MNCHKTLEILHEFIELGRDVPASPKVSYNEFQNSAKMLLISFKLGTVNDVTP